MTNPGKKTIKQAIDFIDNADKLIESLGPEVAEQLIKKGVDTHSVE